MKRRTSVYLRAARLIAFSYEEAKARVKKGENYSYCCCSALALAKASPMKEFRFYRMFARDGAYWWADPGRSLRDQQARVLALLFMHWMEVDP